MHLNDNGQAVAGGAAFCFAALFFLVYSVQQFRQKGRVLDPVILALEKEKREKTCLLYTSPAISVMGT